MLERGFNGFFGGAVRAALNNSVKFVIAVCACAPHAVATRYVEREGADISSPGLLRRLGGGGDWGFGAYFSQSFHIVGMGWGTDWNTCASRADDEVVTG
ncbi:hypothetical protein TK5_01230 [Sideroxyarcus sp. TK5]